MIGNFFPGRTGNGVSNSIQIVLSGFLVALASHTAMAISYVSGTDESYFYAHPMDDAIDVNNLQSRPGAANCLLLWSGGLNKNGYIAWTPPPMEILITFNSVAEDYYPFDVNITTSVSVYNTYSPEHRSYGVYNWTAGGQSLIDAFGNGSNLAVSDFSTGIKTPEHEFGHLMGLDHDGGYFRGDWPLATVMGASISHNAPIVDNSYVNSPLAHWYNGYHGGDSSVDDIALVGSVLGFVPDDYPESQALSIEADGSVIPANNPGGIQSRADTDEWSFTLDNETVVNFTIKPSEIRSPNLFVGVEIVSTDGTTVATGEPHGLYGLESKIDNIILPAGDYYLIIDGIAPATTWFTDYSSFGPYRIMGSLSEENNTNNNAFNAAVPFLLLL